MLELMLETWSTPRNGTTYRWSLWQDGRRVASGNGLHPSLDEAEADGRRYCDEKVGRPPARVTRL